MTTGSKSTVCQLALAILVSGIGACAQTPRDAFRLSETATATREVQTRVYEDVLEIQVLSASSAVLQDLGYVIDEIEKPLGVISASKRADARNDLQTLGTLAADATQCVLTFMLGCTGNRFRESDAVQDIRLTLVARPARNAERTLIVRVTMQRIVWNRDDRLSRQQTISDEQAYRAFFAELDKSVFLEREGL